LCSLHSAEAAAGWSAAHPVSGDNAITSSADDRLGRSGFADQLASSLLGETADDGLVAAVIGPWGQGKSSVLNMVKEQLTDEHKRTVLTFAPWMFSGRDQLVAAFFDQVSGQLRLRGKAERALAGQLISYSQALTPLGFVPHAGVWLAGTGAVATTVSQLRGARKRPDPIERQRRDIDAALRKLADPIFVFIDDVDRLTGPEVRDMLGLVRLTAHFPKIIYLLAFDRAKVELALDQDCLEGGRSYLDKIVELSFDLPDTSRPALGDVLLEGLDQAVSGIETGPLDQARLADVLSRVLRPLLSTPRDVNRYLAALPAGLRMTGDEVALVDVLALEAVRIRLPDVFARLGSMGRALTDVGMFTSQAPGWQEQVVTFAQVGGEHAEVVAELCRLVFPATARYLGSQTTYPGEYRQIWRKQRRVANLEVLGIYLSKQLPPGVLPAATVDMAVTVMPNQQLFQMALDHMNADGLDDFLARIGAYSAEISPDAVLPACTVLLGLYPRLNAESPWLGLPPDAVLDMIVALVLGRVEDVTDRIGTVEALCAGVTSLTGRIRLLLIAGRRPNAGERLIPATDCDRLFRQVCSAIRHIGVAEMTAEADQLMLLATALAEDPADRDDIDHLLEDKDAATALLLSAAAVIRGQAYGSTAVQKAYMMHWSSLATVVGDDAAIGVLVDRVEAHGPDDAAVAQVVALARKYLGGWRPSASPYGQDLVIRQPLNSPTTIFSPSVIGDGWPALLIRAVTTFEVDPAWSGRADLSGGEFHDRLAGFLADVPLAAQVGGLACARHLPDDVSDWTPDPDFHQFSGGAVQRLNIGPAGQPAAVLRYAAFLPDNMGRGPMKLVADVAVSPEAATDAKWGKLSLAETRDALAAALGACADPLAGQILRSIYAGEVPPRSTIELYLWAAQGQSGSRPAITLDKVIDLDALGPPARENYSATQGMFAVAGGTVIASAQDRRNLVVHALIRMALDWGYLDARPRLEPLASA
jgi:KAP family P-loop domain